VDIGQVLVQFERQGTERSTGRGKPYGRMSEGEWFQRDWSNNIQSAARKPPAKPLAQRNRSALESTRWMLCGFVLPLVDK
jgi:hypothetical protein